MQEVQAELREEGLDSRLTEHDATQEFEGLSLRVGHGDEDDFIYDVYLVKAERPNFTLNTSSKLAEYYYRAEVFLREGSQEYDLMGYTKEQVLVDILDHYERHMQYLHLER